MGLNDGTLEAAMATGSTVWGLRPASGAVTDTVAASLLFTLAEISRFKGSSAEPRRRFSHSGLPLSFCVVVTGQERDAGYSERLEERRDVLSSSRWCDVHRTGHPHSKGSSQTACAMRETSLT